MRPHCATPMALIPREMEQSRRPSICADVALALDSCSPTIGTLDDTETIASLTMTPSPSQVLAAKAGSKSFRSACVDPRYARWGLEEGVYFGPPSVMSPQLGDEWVAGKTYVVTWDVEVGGDGKGFVDVYLWRSSTCSGGMRVATLGTGLRNTGRLEVKAPGAWRQRYDPPSSEPFCSSTCLPSYPHA